MSFFPAFIKMDNQKVLVVGGGKIATEKVEKLIDFTNDITIIAKEISVDLKELCDKKNIATFIRSYKNGDIDRYDMVIVAVDNITLQESIYKEAREKKILCNSVDSVNYCDFIFPSYIKKDDLTIAVSTSGASPAVAKYLRRYIEKLLPKNIDIFLKEMKKLRGRMSKGEERMRKLDEKARKFFKL